MSDNSNIQNSLFETMKIFSESATANSGATITVEGVITAIVDEAAGIYTVEYLGSAFNVHTNSNATYSVGDSVYVLVPDGDFTKEKVILGLISASASVYTSDVENGVSYYEVSDNLIDRDPGTIKMSSYRTIAQGANKTNITNYDTTTFSNLMKGYLENYRTFKLSLSAKTALELAQQSKGNYGVSLSIPIKENAATGQGATAQSWKTVYLDVGNFSGTPYRYTAWAPQEVYFTIDEQYTYDSSRVPYYSYYCYDFTQDSTKTNIYDIQLKDISLKVVNAMTTDETSGYTLFLKATQGEYFSTYYSNIKTITPTLKVNGKTTSLKSSAIYWFVEDTAVKADSPDYISYGGYGWKCLNTKTNVGYNDDGTQTFDYITTVQTRDINKSEVKAATRFKCVVIYKDKEISSIITLKNLTVAQSIQLTSSKNLSTQGGTTTIAAAADNTYIKDTGYVDLSAIVYYAGVTNTDKNRNKILYTWARYDKDGNFINDTNDFFVVTANNKMTTIDGKLCYVTQVRYPVNKLEELNTVYCTARYVYTDSSYNTSEEQIGTAQLGVVTNTQYNLNLTINGDNICYKYDSDGDSPMGTAYDGPTTSKVTSITPLTFVVTKADGTELTADEYKYVHYKWTMPKASLFAIDSSTPATKTDDNYYYFEGYGNSLNLLYKIASRFNMSKSKAGLNLTIDFQGSTIEKSAAITFIKEGMSGSNGTAYSAILVSGGTSASDAKSVGYGILNSQGVAQKLKFCYNSSNGTLYRHDYENNTLVNWSTNSKRIYSQVWRDSSLLSYGTHYDIEYSMFDSTTTNPCFAVAKQSDGSCTISLASTPNKDSCNIVQAKITVNDGNTSSANAKQIIYTYYPLELTITNFTPKMIPSMDGGFAEVMYASDGTNPSYDETSNFVINDDKVVQSDLPDTASYFSITWDASSHLGIYDVNADGTTTGTKRSTKATPTVKIKPDNKYDDGNSKNFIRATLSFNSSKRTELNNKRSNASIAIASAQNAIIEESDNYSYINNVISTYNSCVGNWYSYLDRIKELLARQTNAMYAIEKLQDELIKKTQEYIKYQEQYSDKATELKRQLVHLEQEMNVLNKQCILAANKLKTLNGTTGYKTSDLISLEEYKIKISETEQELWKTNLGRETAEMLMISVDQMNEEIVHYQKQYDMLQQSIYNTQLQTYNQIRIDLENIANQIGGNAFSYYAELRNLIYAACKSFDGGVSYEYLSRQLEWLENVFCSFANANNNNHKLILIQSIIDEYRQNIASYNNIIAENQQTINCIDAILSTSGYTLYHIRPVVLYFNRYEMSNLNAWDGNKTEVKDGYILTPQVGAGTKESDNSFTGVVMGLKKISSSSTRKGLYGYHFGTQSFVLDAENGSAIFGKSGTGQIVIDPSSSNSLLYSSNYWSSYNNNTGLPSNYNSSNQSGKGMCLDLKNGTIHLGSAATGKIYSASHATFADNNNTGFYLSHDGLSLVSKYNKDGGTQTSRIEMSTTGDPKLYSNSHSALASTRDGFYLSQDGLSIGSDFTISTKGIATLLHEGSDLGNWKLDSNGRLVSKKNSGIALDSPNSLIVLGSSDGAIYSGQHSTKISTKKGFYLSNDGLSISGTYTENGTSYTSRFELSTDSDPKMYTGKHTSLSSKKSGFYLGSDGLSIGDCIEANVSDTAVYIGKRSGSKKWTISGDSNNSYITYDSTGFQNGTVYIGTNGISLKDKFSVNDAGYLLSTSGLIGGWVIGDDSISSNNIELKSKGSIRHTGGTWEIKQDGSATFKNLSATSKDGETSSWSINRNGSASFSNVTITGGSLTIKKNGTENAKIATNGDATFHNITCTGIVNATGGYLGKSGSNSISSSGLNFNAGGIGLGTAASGSSGISYSSSGCTISGTIYANAGRFGTKAGSYISLNSDGSASIPSACISELEVSKIKAGKVGTKTVDWRTINSITGMSISLKCVTASIASKWNKGTGEPTEYSKYWICGMEYKDNPSANDIINKYQFTYDKIYVLSSNDGSTTGNGSVNKG